MKILSTILLKTAIFSLFRDSFIAEEMCHKHPFIKGKLRDFKGEGISMRLPLATTKFRNAVLHFKIKQLIKFMKAWIRFVFQNQTNCRTMIIRNMAADTHYTSRRIAIVFRAWNLYTVDKINRSCLAASIISNLQNHLIALRTFKTWMINANVTHETFTRLENQTQSIEKRKLAMLMAATSFSIEDELDWFSEFPALIQQKIFSYLTPVEFMKCSSVNRMWKVAVDENAAASELNLSSINQRVTDEIFMKLLQPRKTRIHIINLDGCHGITASGFSSGVSICSNLQDVNFSGCLQLTDEAIHSLTVHNPVLLKLNLSFTRISNKSLRIISQKATRLSWLSIAYCLSVSDIGVSFFEHSSLVSSLTHLDISGCTGLTRSGLANLVAILASVSSWVISELPLANQRILQALGKRTVLESLTLCRTSSTPKPPKSNLKMHSNITSLMNAKSVNVSIKPSMNGIKTKTTVPMFRTVCRSELKTLRIHGDARLCDQDFEPFNPTETGTEGRINPGLESQVLSGLKRLTNNWILAIKQKRLMMKSSPVANVVENTHRLKMLSVVKCRNVTNTIFSHLFTLNHLTCLNLSHCYLLSDVGMNLLANSSFISRLQELYLAHCYRTSDSGMMNVAKKLNDISYLSLEGCYNITEKTVYLLAELPKLCWINIADTLASDHGLSRLGALPRLVHLNISGCSYIKDSGLQMFAAQSISYEKIYLAKCTLISDIGIKALTASNRRLQLIDLSGCKCVTNVSIFHLARTCPYLQHLDISNNVNITEAPLKLMVKSCPQLKYLGLQNCTSVSNFFCSKFDGKHSRKKYPSEHDDEE